MTAYSNLRVKRRSLFLLIVFTFLIFALAVRTGWLQIVRGEELQKKAYKDQTLDRLINPHRGIIYDRNGKKLAISASVETVSVNPQDLKARNSLSEIKNISADLASILDMDEEEVYKKLIKNTRFEFIKRQIDKEIGSRVREYINEKNIRSIYVDEDSKRFYPNSNLASHVIGFTRVDNVGLYGIELVMDKYLKGAPGKLLSEVDARGISLPFRRESRIDATDGFNVVLTIDETIQHFTEKALEKAILDNNLKLGAAGIVMDPKTGEILAMASKPDFNLNNPWAKPKDLDWPGWTGHTSEEVNILSKTVWRNKALQDSYEPGSTFKAITAAAALEENVVTPDTAEVCTPITFAGHLINCWKDGGHGPETFREGVYNSCNPVFVKVGLDLGIKRFYKYVKAFGFKDKTGIILPGEAETIWHKDPKEIDLAVSSFGQRFQVAPLHMVLAYSAIANGGNLMKPLIVKEITDNEGNVINRFEPVVVRKVISKQTSDTLRDILQGVVSEGTGKNAYVRGYRVAGKTGTSETLDSKRYIASFIAFAPADDPRICVLVMLDYPQVYPHTGGMIAAPVAGRLVEEILDYLGVERVYSEIDKEMMLQEIYVPEVRKMSLSKAQQVLKEYSLKYIIEGDNKSENAVVKEQTPKPGASIPQGSTVILYTYEPEEELTVEMPNVLNKTIKEAADTLKKRGLNIKVEGLGKAHEQEFKPGTVLKKGQVVKVVFKHTDTD